MKCGTGADERCERARGHGLANMVEEASIF